MLISSAIEEGIRCGFENAAFDRCSGAEDPEDRCPMQPSEGCACLYVVWRRLPWWRRMMTSKPLRPSEKAVLSGIVSDYVQHTDLEPK